MPSVGLHLVVKPPSSQEGYSTNDSLEKKPSSISIMLVELRCAKFKLTDDFLVSVTCVEHSAVQFTIGVSPDLIH